MEREKMPDKNLKITKGKIIEVNLLDDGTVEIIFDEKGKGEGYLVFMMRPDFQRKIKYKDNLMPGMDIEFQVDEDGKIRNLTRILH